MPSFVEMGRRRQNVNRLRPAKRRMRFVCRQSCRRSRRDRLAQVQKWGIAASELPDDAIVHFSSQRNGGGQP